MRLAEEVDQAAQAVFAFKRAERDRFRRQRLAALGIARRVARRATAGVEQLLALGSGHGVGRFRGEAGGAGRQEELGEIFGDVRALGGRLV